MSNGVWETLLSGEKPCMEPYTGCCASDPALECMPFLRSRPPVRQSFQCSRKVRVYKFLYIPGFTTKIQVPYIRVRIQSLVNTCNVRYYESLLIIMLSDNCCGNHYVAWKFLPSVTFSSLKTKCASLCARCYNYDWFIFVM